MTTSEPCTWLAKLEERMNIDVDWMDPVYIQSMSIRPHDQTSNPSWLSIQLQDSSNEVLLANTAKELLGEEWVTIYTRMAAKMCEKNLGLIRGRVLVQTLPTHAYDVEATLEHARLYDREFQKLGISRDRFCIKILATGPGVTAAAILQQEGIQTLGTGVFSVAQAIACSQAGCLYISPYYNEVRTGEDPSLWPNVKDPATQHPFSNRILQMVDAFKRLYALTGKQQPLVKNAAFGSIEEVIATAELGCHSATISPRVIDELARTPYDASKDTSGEKTRQKSSRNITDPIPERLLHLLAADPLATGDFIAARIDIDYLADNGAELEAALGHDPVGRSRLKDALAWFERAENSSKAFILEKSKITTV